LKDGNHDDHSENCSTPAEVIDSLRRRALDIAEENGNNGASKAIRLAI
jgi:hypothetical protein